MTTADRPTDHVMPQGAWAFDEGVTAVFDDMLNRSIPQYDVMRSLVFDIGSRFVSARPMSTVVDLGASRGEALAPFLNRFGAKNRWVAVEVSEPMRAAMTERFEGFINTSVVQVRGDDLRYGYPPVGNVSLTLCVLTAQFVPIEYRQKLLRNIFETTGPGGALILVEKVLGDGSLLDEIFVDRYLAMKAEHGYSQDEIDRKRFSLEGILSPLTAEWNENLLRRAGFVQVDGFWRWLNFAGWVAVK